MDRRPRCERAPYPPPGSNDPHEERRGETAEDRGGVGHGEEGYVAHEYAGRHKRADETDEEHAERVRAAREGPASQRPEGAFEPLAPREAERIERALCERLERLGRSCRDLRHELRHRTVALHGEVPDEDAKLEIEGVCSTIPGVERVESHLRPRS